MDHVQGLKVRCEDLKELLGQNVECLRAGHGIEEIQCVWRTGGETDAELFFEGKMAVSGLDEVSHTQKARQINLKALVIPDSALYIF